MRLRFVLSVIALVLLAGLAGCSSTSSGPVGQAPPEPPVDAASTFSIADRKSARELYLAKCARCHKFDDPAKYPDKEWHEWMDKMSRKARLRPEQNELLLRYLDLYRDGSRTNTDSR
jgi:cytochrome c553